MTDSCEQRRSKSPKSMPKFATLHCEQNSAIALLALLTLLTCAITPGNTEALAAVFTRYLRCVYATVVILIGLAAPELSSFVHRTYLS